MKRKYLILGAAALVVYFVFIKKNGTPEPRVLDLSESGSVAPEPITLDGHVDANGNWVWG